jgi:hypothetical protein
MYLHRVEVVVQRSKWQDMIPPLGYHNFKEKQQKILRNICSFVQRSGKQNKSLMNIPNLRRAITLRDSALDCYMSQHVNNALGMARTLTDTKKLLINEFQNPRLEHQYMNEMIEIRQKPRESIWEIDQRFKRLKGKLKYLMTDM